MTKQIKLSFISDPYTVLFVLNKTHFKSSKTPIVYKCSKIKETYVFEFNLFYCGRSTLPHQMTSRTQSIGSGLNDKSCVTIQNTLLLTWHPSSCQ